MQSLNTYVINQPMILHSFGIYLFALLLVLSFLTRKILNDDNWNDEFKSFFLKASLLVGAMWLAYIVFWFLEKTLSILGLF